MSVFFVLLLLAFLALTINVGRLMRTRGDLQHAADSAALAAAENLDVKPAGGPPEGRSSSDFDLMLPGSAQNVAKAHAEAFTVMDWAGQKPDINDPGTGLPDVQFGFWHLKGAEPCIFSAGGCPAGWEAAPATPTALQLFAINSVRTTTRFPVPPLLQRFAKVGTTNLTARATALGRRTRVKCALPFALSVCHLMDADEEAGAFSCTVPKNLVLTSPAWSDRWAVGRIDLRGTATETALMRDFVREGTYHHCDEDAADVEYQVGQARMPDGPTPRPILTPIINGIVGIEDEAGSQTPGRCMFGTTYVVPVVWPSSIGQVSDCDAIVPYPDPAVPPPAGAQAWPVSDNQMVVGYVNIVVTSITCFQGPTFVLNAANCETALDPGGGLLANNCTGPEPATQNQIAATVTCDAPVGPPPDPTLSLHPRLVR